MLGFGGAREARHRRNLKLAVDSLYVVSGSLYQQKPAPERAVSSSFSAGAGPAALPVQAERLRTTVGQPAASPPDRTDHRNTPRSVSLLVSADFPLAMISPLRTTEVAIHYRK